MGSSRKTTVALLITLFAGVGAGAGCGGGDDNPAQTPGGPDGGGAKPDASGGAEGGGAPDGAAMPDGSTTDAGGVTGVDVSGDVAKLDAELARAICAKLDACCSSDDAQVILGPYENTPYTEDCKNPPCATITPGPTCAADLAKSLGRVHGSWAASVKRGNMTFDRARGEACVAALDAAACGAPFRERAVDPACLGLRDNDVFHKVGKLGAACEPVQDSTFYGECDPATGFCDSKFTHECKAWAKTGETCTIFGEWSFCSPELECNDPSFTPDKPGKCSKPPREVGPGEVCYDVDSPNLTCPAGQWCDVFGTKKCSPKKADGDACFSDEECQNGHPFTCEHGKCGGTAFCSGAPAHDAGTDGASDAGAADSGTVTDAASGSDADAAPPATAPTFTIQREGDATPPSDHAAGGQRARFLLRWDVPGASSVSLDGAGTMVAVVRDGLPVYDDLSTVAGDAPTAVLGAPLPVPVTILGDVWNQIAINPHGVISRGKPGLAAPLDTTLPIATRGIIQPDWADGTIAPFMDRHLSARDASSKIKQGTFGTGSDQRYVVEWSEMTTTTDFKSALPAHLTFQVALYVDGRVEYRYKTVALDAGTPLPNADLADVQGQGAAIGIASSDGKLAVPLSIRRASIHGGMTVTFTPATALPPSGQAIVVAPEVAGDLAYTLHAAGLADAVVRATVGPLYTMTTAIDAQPPRDLTTVPGATTQPIGDTVALDLPFAVDVFGDAWRGLALSRTGAIGPWGIGTTELGSGLNGGTIPGRAGPNDFIAFYYAAGYSAASWCTSAAAPEVTSVVEGVAPSRTVSVQMKGIHRCGQTPSLDAQVVLHENGDVELLYANLTGADDTLTGKGILVGLENGNGDVAFKLAQDTAGTIASNLHVTFTRH